MKTGSQHAIVVKKTHSIKNNLLCTNQLRIVWLSSTYEGHVHDKKICDEEPLLLPKGIRLWQDTGFIGHRPDGVEICMPKKKPEGKELTAVEKQENKRISGIRIKVEHAIGGMKKCRIVKERFNQLFNINSNDKIHCVSAWFFNQDACRCKTQRFN